MKKILVLLLCIFSLSFGYTQIDSFKTIKLNVPSYVTVKTDTLREVYVPDTSMFKCLNIYVRDSILHIDYTKPYYHEILKEPIKMRISTPDSVNITTTRYYIMKR